jgi:Peptidase A4 family
VPRSEPQIGRTHNLRGSKQVGDSSYTSHNWAGGVLAGTWTGAVGFWQIPTVSMPGEPQGSAGGWDSSSWVGIDGAYGSDDVLQAGVAQAVDASGNASYVAWYEWYAPPQPDSPSYINQTNISNFPVSPGDTVYCLVQYVSNNTAGQISFANETTGQYFTITLAPPPGASLSGNCAEWIMEAPSIGSTSTVLPDFTPVTFTSASCCGPDNTTGDPVNGDTYTQVSAAGIVSTAETLASGTVTISYTGPAAVVISSALACFGVDGAAARVYYLDGNSHVHELSLQDGWVNTPL